MTQPTGRALVALIAAATAVITGCSSGSGDGSDSTSGVRGDASVAYRALPEGLIDAWNRQDASAFTSFFCSADLVEALGDAEDRDISNVELDPATRITNVTYHDTFHDFHTFDLNHNSVQSRVDAAREFGIKQGMQWSVNGDTNVLEWPRIGVTLEAMELSGGWCVNHLSFMPADADDPRFQ